MDSYENLVFKKAAKISNQIKGVTIGVNCNSYSVEKYNDCRLSKDSKSVNAKEMTESSALLNDKDEHDANFQKLVLRNIEDRRQLKVKAAMKNRLEKMMHENEFYRAQLEYRQLMDRQELEEQRLNTERNILRELEEEEAEARERQAELEQRHQAWAQKINERNKKIREIEEKERQEEEDRRRRLKERIEILDKIFECQHKYGNIYQQILESTRICVDKHALVSVITNLKTLNVEMDELVRQCQVKEVSVEDLHKAVDIVSHISTIQEEIQKEVEQINAKHERERVAAQASIIAENEVRQPFSANTRLVNLQASVPGVASPSKSSQNTQLSDFVDRDAFQVYKNLQNYLRDFENSIEGLTKNDKMKKFRFDCQKAVNVPVNAISPVSAEHLNDKFNRLSNLLSGKVVDVGTSRFRASDHPLGVAFCKNLLAKKFVCQGELTVSSKPEAAFALAAVIVALWVEFPDFGQLILAYFYRDCPYLIPLFMPQVEGQSNEDYYRSLGYRYSESGEVESQPKFLKRMTGVTHLYTAILVTHLKRQHQHVQHPHSLNNAWRWFACILNLDPRPDICATVLLTFLEVCGSMMHATYGRQFEKLLSAISGDYFKKLQHIAASPSGGPLVRLHTFLQDKVMKYGKIPPPAGLLSPSFW